VGYIFEPIQVAGEHLGESYRQGRYKRNLRRCTMTTERSDRERLAIRVSRSAGERCGARMANPSGSLDPGVARPAIYTFGILMRITGRGRRRRPIHPHYQIGLPEGCRQMSRNLVWLAPFETGPADRYSMAVPERSSAGFPLGIGRRLLWASQVFFRKRTFPLKPRTSDFGNQIF